MPQPPKKDKIISLRCNDLEIDKIDNLAAKLGITRSEYLWQKIKSKPVTPKASRINWQVYKKIVAIAELIEVASIDLAKGKTAAATASKITHAKELAEEVGLEVIGILEKEVNQSSNRT